MSNSLNSPSAVDTVGDSNFIITTTGNTTSTSTSTASNPPLRSILYQESWSPSPSPETPPPPPLTPPPIHNCLFSPISSVEQQQQQHNPYPPHHHHSSQSTNNTCSLCNRRISSTSGSSYSKSISSNSENKNTSHSHHSHRHRTNNNNQRNASYADQLNHNSSSTYNCKSDDSISYKTNINSSSSSGLSSSLSGGEDDDNMTSTTTSSANMELSGKISITREPISLAKLEKIHPKQAEGMYRSPRYIMHRLLPEQVSVKSFFYSVFPILKWLPKYNIKEDLTLDVVAGVTVLALQIPQGLAYSKLAGVDPIYGLYSTFFSMIIYSVLGTSRHMSMGLFSITSMMCRNVVLNYHGDLDDPDPPREIDILITLCFITGIIQLAIGVFRLGNCSLLFSDNFLSAFNVGCTVLIINSQIAPTLGIDFASDENKDLGIPSDCINTWISIVRHIPESNPGTLVLSAGVFALLLGTKYIIEPYVRRKYAFRYTIPIDLISVIITTIISMTVNLHDKYKIDIVGDIPNTFAVPKAPRMDLIPNIMIDGVIMAIVASVCQVSMAKLLAKKYNYEIALNQEFVAYGVTNTICSFNYCFPTCASLARTNVNENAGVRTQLSTLLCSVLLLVCLFFLTTFLGPLPKATLGCIIIVAMLPTFDLVKDFITVWSISRFDAFLWLVTCFTVTFFGVNIGIYCGMACSILILLLRAAIPTSSIMYPVPESELYLSPNVYGNLNGYTLQQNKIAIFCFQGPLTFLSAATFRTDTGKKILEPLKDERICIAKTEANMVDMNSNTLDDHVVAIDAIDGTNGTFALEREGKFDVANVSGHSSLKHRNSIAVAHQQHQQQQAHHPRASMHSTSTQSIRTLILDMSQIISIDLTGIEMIVELKDQLKRYDVNLLLACCSISALSTLERANFFTKVLPKEFCFLSVHDAVVAAGDEMGMCENVRAKLNELANDYNDEVDNINIEH